MPDCTKCTHRIYFEGCKIPSGDPGYPERAWGAYLPGDEPGWVCNVDGDETSEDMPPEKCPLCDKVKVKCPNCIMTGVKHQVYESEMDGDLYCDTCDGTWADRGELLDDFAYCLEEAYKK